MSNVHQKVAFRCSHCGHLVPASAAGECKTPHACPGCGCGVHFVATIGAEGKKALDAKVGELTKKHGSACRVTRHDPVPGHLSKLVEHDHWEVLATATVARLKELGLTKADVEAHTPAPKTGPVRPARIMEAHGKEEPAVKDDAG